MKAHFCTKKLHFLSKTTRNNVNASTHYIQQSARMRARARRVTSSNTGIQEFLTVLVHDKCNTDKITWLPVFVSWLALLLCVRWVP
jgi:hypothetical protein